MYSLATYQKLSHIRAHELSTAGSRKPACMLVCIPKIHLCCQVLGAEKKAKDKNNETYNTWQLGSRLPNLFWISIPGKLGLLIRRLLKQVRIKIQQNQNLKKNRRSDTNLPGTTGRLTDGSEVVLHHRLRNQDNLLGFVLACFLTASGT